MLLPSTYSFISVKTRTILPPQDDIFAILDEFILELSEGDILCITSKILAIHQGRCVKISPEINKNELIKSESSYWMMSDYNYILTITDNTLIASAGIDESNGNGYYVLWPKNSDALLLEIRDFLCKKFKISNLGIISTDTKTIPLRTGVVGTAIHCVGFDPLKNYVGELDLFARSFAVTQVNIAESIANFAVFLMGEGNESTPMVIARGIENIKFNCISTTKNMTIDPEIDLFKPMLETFFHPENKGGCSK